MSFVFTSCKATAWEIMLPTVGTGHNKTSALNKQHATLTSRFWRMRSFLLILLIFLYVFCEFLCVSMFVYAHVCEGVYACVYKYVETWG